MGISNNTKVQHEHGTISVETHARPEAGRAPMPTLKRAPGRSSSEAGPAAEMARLVMQQRKTNKTRGDLIQPLPAAYKIGRFACFFPVRVPQDAICDCVCLSHLQNAKLTLHCLILDHLHYSAFRIVSRASTRPSLSLTLCHLYY